jgi:hypothetical protein
VPWHRCVAHSNRRSGIEWCGVRCAAAARRHPFEEAFTVKHLVLSLCVLAAGAAFFGCGHPETSLGSVVVGGVTFDVASEGSNTAGAMNNYAIQPRGGNAGITSLTCGVGATMSAATTVGRYDAIDGDYDCNTLIPASTAGAMLWITVTKSDGATASGAVALPTS